MKLPGLARREPHSGLKMFPRDVWPIAHFESLGPPTSDGDTEEPEHAQWEGGVRTVKISDNTSQLCLNLDLT